MVADGDADALTLRHIPPPRPPSFLPGWLARAQGRKPSAPGAPDRRFPLSLKRPFYRLSGRIALLLGGTAIAVASFRRRAGRVPPASPPRHRAARPTGPPGPGQPRPGRPLVAASAPASGRPADRARPPTEPRPSGPGPGMGTGPPGTTGTGPTGTGTGTSTGAGTTRAGTGQAAPSPAPHQRAAPLRAARPALAPLAVADRLVAAAWLPLDALAVPLPEPAVDAGERLEPVRLQPVLGRLRHPAGRAGQQDGHGGTRLAVQCPYPDPAGAWATSRARYVTPWRAWQHELRSGWY